MYEIEHNTPAPPPARSNRVYPFPDMEPGDSFLVPCEVTELAAVTLRVRRAVKVYRRRHAPETRWRTKSTIQGVHVWRVE